MSLRSAFGPPSAELRVKRAQRRSRDRNAAARRRLPWRPRRVSFNPEPAATARRIRYTACPWVFNPQLAATARRVPVDDPSRTWAGARWCAVGPHFQIGHQEQIDAIKRVVRLTDDDLGPVGCRHHGIGMGHGKLAPSSRQGTPVAEHPYEHPHFSAAFILTADPD
jgi:hypothetical protein